MIAIIGGGISGLTAAYYLAKFGLRSTVIEAQSRLGGVMQTEVVDGCVIEHGPDSYLAAKPWASELIHELGLGDQIIGSNESRRKTFIVRSGKLVPMPEGLQLMIPTRVWPIVRTPLLSLQTKSRMAAEWFRRPVVHPDRSVADFVADHYGLEAVEYLAEPLLAGVYGGEPESLGADSVLPKFVEFERKYGSIARGALAARKPRSNTPLFETLRSGFGGLVDALRARLEGAATFVHRPAQAVEKQAQGWRVRWNDEWQSFDSVILACGARASAKLLAQTDARLSELLASIPHNSAVTVALGYRRSDVSHPQNGFGFLVPRRERNHVMACTWVGSKWPEKIPADKSVLRCFLGAEQAIDKSDDDLVAAARTDLSAIMGVQADPIFARVSRWPAAMPQYTVGHQPRIAEIEDRARAHGGLYVTGNYGKGIGVPDAIREAKSVATRRNCEASGDAL